MCMRMVWYLDEIQQYMVRAYEKYQVGVNTVKIGFFADSIPNFYYSMLFAATALLTMKNDKPKTHEGTLAKFGQVLVLHDDFDRKVAKYFSQTETLRDKVDYDAFNGVTEDIALKKMEQCRLFLKESNNILKKYGMDNAIIKMD